MVGLGLGYRTLEGRGFSDNLPQSEIIIQIRQRARSIFVQQERSVSWMPNLHPRKITETQQKALVGGRDGPGNS